MSAQFVWIAAAGIGAYLVGSIPFGVILARIKGVDLRAVGSGNIGATNVARALGRKWGMVVFLLDATKGVGPVLFGRFVLAVWLGGSGYLFGAVCAGAAVAGHMFPLYLRLRGGKGVATGAGATAALLPLPLAIAVITWVVALLIWRIVSVASISSAAAFIAAFFAIGPAPHFSPQILPATVYALTLSTLVILRHKSNIRRLIEGKEPKIGKKSASEASSG